MIESSPAYFVELFGIDRAAVDADADRAVVLARHVDELRDLLRDRLLRLDVVEVARVVADLLDVRRDLLGEPVVLLEVDDEIRRRLRGGSPRAPRRRARVSTAMRMMSAPAASRRRT